MKLIRKQAFETNSSSCHSLTVGSGDCLNGITPNDENVVVVPLMEFGWEQDTYNDVYSKLSYVYLYIRDWCGEGDKQERFMEMFKKVICEHSGADDVVPEEVSGSWCNGYIDHQSVEGGDLDFLFESETELRNFLFDPSSYIETDNDNH